MHTHTHTLTHTHTHSDTHSKVIAKLNYITLLEVEMVKPNNNATLLQFALRLVSFCMFHFQSFIPSCLTVF